MTTTHDVPMGKACHSKETDKGGVRRRKGHLVHLLRRVDEGSMLRAPVAGECMPELRGCQSPSPESLRGRIDAEFPAGGGAQRAAPRAAQYSDTTGRELNNPRLEIGEIRVRMSSYSAFVSAVTTSCPALPLDPASCRIHSAKAAVNAGVAVAHRPPLPALQSE